MANVGEPRRSGNRLAEKFVPTSDWTHDDKASYLFVDLPGFKKEELRLELASNGHIIITGERIVNETKSMYFEHSFALPENSDMDKINGKFDGDFLHVTVPKLSVAVPVPEENKQKDISHENHDANGLGETSSVQNETNINQGDQTGNKSKHEDYEGHDGHEQRHCFAHVDEAAKGEMIDKEASRVASFPKEMLKKWEEEDGPLEMTMNFLKKNKGVVISVVIAVSVGVYICRTFD